MMVRAGALAMLALLAACGGDGGQINTVVKTIAKTSDYTLGGTIDLQLVNAPPDVLTGLVLNDGTENYAPTLQTGGQTDKKISFSFPTPLPEGTKYAVSVVSSPQGIGCVASNNKGTIGAAPVTTVTITCTDSVFHVSGNVHLNFANPLPSIVELAISDGTDSIAVQLPAGAKTGKLIPFTFPTPLKSGASYHVTVPSNPPDLTCTPANASGTIAATNVTNVSVTCSDSAFYLSGKATVSLKKPYTSNTATVLLTDGTDLAYPVNVSIGKGALTASQSFIFPSLVAQGAAYTVSVTTDPPGNPIGLTCTPSNNRGTVKNANITNIAVNCSDAAYSLGGTVTGLQFAGSVQLSDGIGPPLLIGVGTTAFTFPTNLAYNSQYAVKIQGQSLVQCTLGNATGAVLGPVRDLTVQCSLPELALLAGGGSGPAGDNPLIGQGASFNYPNGVAVDHSGNVYVADTDDNKIRRISPAGVVTTIAGSLTGGSRNGTGSAASFQSPIAVAVDSNDNIYVADSGNNEVRKITPAGSTTTLTSSAALGDCGGSVEAGDQYPTGVVIGASDTLYIVCGGEILKRSSNGVLTTFANFYSESLGYSVIAGVAVDASGNVYVATRSGNFETSSILKVTPGGVISTVASEPIGCIPGCGFGALAVDARDNVYEIEGFANQIKKVTPSGIITPFAGSGSQGSADGIGTAASFFFPSGLAFDAAGNLYVADADNNEIRMITAAADVTTVAGYVYPAGSTDGVGSAARFSSPSSATFDPAGNLYVVDEAGIRKITPAGIVTTPAGYNKPIGEAPSGVVVDTKGNLYIAYNQTVRKITATGVTTTVATLPVSPDCESYNLDGGIAVDPSGNIYVTATYSADLPDCPDVNVGYIFKFTPSGAVTTLASYQGDGFLGGVALDASGNLYVANLVPNQISKITPAGVITRFAGSGAQGHGDGAGSTASFNSPLGIAIDSAGDIYVADSGNNEIRKITPAGYVTTIVGNINQDIFLPGSLPGSLGPPNSVALSPPDQFGNWNMVIATRQNLIAEVLYASAVFY
jgi:sugar lactone lactonase YvrE